MNILIAPSGFKEGLDAGEVADAIITGVKRVWPDARVFALPLVDGGEGFTRVLADRTGGQCHGVTVTGPVGKPVEGHFGFLGQSSTAVLEMASAAGLRLVPRDQRDPLVTSTRGVGELIRAALDAGATKILVGCGDSGTNDGGAGAAQALGVRLLDRNGKDLPLGGKALLDLDRIDVSDRDPRLAGINIDVACNWHNILCGPKGVARVFGPQKGASPETVDTLEAALERFAAIIQRDIGVDVRSMPGGGASGGLGTGLSALLGATLHPRFDIVTQYLDLDGALAEADLVITAEGAIDHQTPRGKIPAEVARRAKQRELPVIALAGTIGDGARENLAHGIDAYFSLVNRPMPLSAALENAAELLTDSAESALRAVRLGSQLARPLR